MKHYHGCTWYQATVALRFHRLYFICLAGVCLSEVVSPANNYLWPYEERHTHMHTHVDDGIIML